MDGHNLLFRAFYGIPARILPSGKPVHGTIGFLGLLKKIANIIKPSHSLVVFDSEFSCERKNEYESYKANRESFEKVSPAENPFSQLADIKHALDKLQMSWIEPNGFEADDVIASYANVAQMPVVIASADSDLFQVINDDITVLRYNGKKSVMFNKEELFKRYCINPNEVVLYKAIIGDSADNIIGIKGVGPKKALKIIRGELTVNPDEQVIINRNKKLITLRNVGSLSRDIESLKHNNKLEKLAVGKFLKEINIL